MENVFVIMAILDLHVLLKHVLIHAQIMVNVLKGNANVNLVTKALIVLLKSVLMTVLIKEYAQVLLIINVLVMMASVDLIAQ
jgi:hypothetical protein